MRKLLVMLSLFVVLGLCLPSPAMAATYDLAADFSADQNPNGVWSYGWTESRASTFQLATTSGEGSHPEGTLKGWIPYEGIMSPAYAVTDWDAQTHFIPAGTVALHPGSLCENSVVRWTAPSAGTYTIQGWFDGNDFSHPTSTDVAIRHGTTEIFTGAINSYNVPLNFSLTRQLNAGDTIDFAVGCGSNGNYFGDSTGISATIMAVPPDDNTPPVITPDISGTQGDNGWYTGNVTVSWTVSDGESPVTSQSGCDTTTITQDTAGTTLTCQATSAGGANEESVTIKRDATAPTISASLNKNPDPDTGWFNAATGAPTVSFQCDDPTPGSGLPAGACPSSHTFANSADQSHSGTVSDIAGNQASDGVSDVDVDLIAPSKPEATTNPANPVENSGGWFKDAVRVSYSGSTDEGGSGLANPAYSPVDVFDTSGEHTYSGLAKDNAGNHSEPATGSLKVDADDPTLAISGCPTSAVSLNSSQSINVTASDGHSGLADDPSGTLTLDTSSAGSHDETVTATDKVGHSKSATCSYSVTYDFSGFFSPVDNLPTLNSVKAGAAVPVKFSLGGDQGLEIFEATYPKSQQISCDSTAPVDNIEQTVTANASGLTYDTSIDQYNYVWKTNKAWAGSCRQFVMKLNDGSTHRANFKFK